ncbi:hypothetical protein BT63DRAFT_425671 [Microthyrium microscopicum]|uniref:Uncharacterized protein n=1 Tax=Microthyrium microscopicum TaxID=703497 RepID=A0A6A6U7X1_9PEZI|nr:hypothetical protein BT63DRAFT_425671 [Microthyrium microscopicum]
MRSQLQFLALPALCAAADQQPLADTIKSWFNLAKEYIPTSVPTSIPNPVAAATAKVADLAVTPITFYNWHSTLQPGLPKASGEPDEWLIYFTGGNTTCLGRCDNTTAAWNTSVAILTASTAAPQLGSVDCESEDLLCKQWAVGPPTIAHVLIPSAGSPNSPIVRYIALNTSSTTAADITEIISKRKFEQTPPYEGVFQPWTGLLATYGFAVPAAYAMWGFSKMPSWLPMILISFLSRSFMGRGRGMPQDRGAAAPAAAQ